MQKLKVTMRKGASIGNRAANRSLQSSALFALSCCYGWAARTRIFPL